jgi:uncharacterized protein involved in exopolysaccharide biosynthesis
MAKDIEKRTPRDLLRIVFRRRALFLVGASVFAVGWLVAARALPVQYTATTVFERRSDEASQEQSKNSPGAVEALRLAMPYDLKGYDAVAQAAENLDLTRGLPHDKQGELTPAGKARKQELVLRLMKAVSVTTDVKTEQVDRVSVSFTDADPRLVQQLPDRLVRNYMNFISNDIVKRLTESREFHARQAQESRGRKQQLTADLIDFETKHAGMMPDDPGAIKEQLDKITTDIEAIRRQQTEATENAAKLKEMVAARKPNDSEEPLQVVKGPNPELQRLKEQRDQAQEQLDSAKTLSHMTEKHPMVATLRAKIADLEARIKETPEEAVLHTVYGQGTTAPDGLDIQLASEESTVKVMKDELERLLPRQAQLQKQMANFGPVRQEYLKLRADLMEQEAEMKRREAPLLEVETALAAEVAQRRTRLAAIQLALPQYKPSDPKLHYILGVALVGGLAFGGGLVFLSNVMDRAVRTTEDAVEGFGLPIFGVIDEIVTPQERFKRRLLRWTIGPVLSVVILIGLGLSSLSVVLWLQYPDELEKWKAHPVSFLLSPALTMEQPPKPEEVTKAPEAPAAPAPEPAAPAAETPAGSNPANGASPVPLAPQRSTNAKP